MALPEGVDFESLLEQLTKMYEAIERLVFVRKAHLGGEGQGEFKEAQDQAMAAVGQSKQLAGKFREESTKPGGFNLQSFVDENSDELQVAARKMHDSNEKAGNLFHDQIGGASVDFDKDVEVEINGDKVRTSLHKVHEELKGPNDAFKQAYGWPQTGPAPAHSDDNGKVLAGGNISVSHDANENDRPWSVAGKVAPGSDKKTTIGAALDELNSRNGTNYALVNKNGSLNIYDGDRAINPAHQTELNKIMISQASGGSGNGKASDAFWQGLVSSGYIQGDPKYYSSGEAKPEEYKHAFETALASVDATGNQAEKDKFWSGMVSEGLIEGDPAYYAQSKASTDEYNHALNVASGTNSAPGNPSPMPAPATQQNQAANTPSDPNPSPGAVVAPQQAVNSAEKAFWEGLVASGHIQGDPEYYYSGKATAEEYKHAFNTSWAAVQNSGDKAEADKFWSEMVSLGYVEGDPVYYSSGDANSNEYENAINTASVAVNPEQKAFWEGLVASGHIQGDPEYYYSGKASEDEYKNAFKTALAAVDATENQDVKDRFWSGMVSAGYVEGDPLYYSRAQAGTAEYDNAINVASGTAETRAFWEGMVASGHIQGDPEYYYSGKASPDEYKHAFNTAWKSVQASGDQAAKDKFWSGMVSSGYIEGDSSYYSSGQAQASEYDHAFNVAGGVADTVAKTASGQTNNASSGSSLQPQPSPRNPGEIIEEATHRATLQSVPEAFNDPTITAWKPPVPVADTFENHSTAVAQGNENYIPTYGPINDREKAIASALDEHNRTSSEDVKVEFFTNSDGQRQITYVVGSREERFSGGTVAKPNMNYGLASGSLKETQDSVNQKVKQSLNDLAVAGGTNTEPKNDDLQDKKDIIAAGAAPSTPEDSLPTTYAVGTGGSGQGRYVQ